MTDADYIKKAVGLADGFEILNDKIVGELLETTEGFFSLDGQIPKDILAAQLVRQVDALDGNHYIYPFDGVSDMVSPDGNTKAHGPDRTMNTIRAIVDSGVLE